MGNLIIPEKLEETTVANTGASASGTSDPEKLLVKEAALGHLEVVSAILAKYPDKVSCSFEIPVDKYKVDSLNLGELYF